MKAVALFGVFVVAKLAILAGRPIQLSGWDAHRVLLAGRAGRACVFALLDGAVRRQWFGWILYGAVVLYVAINVPIALVLSSPLTWPMLGAAGGALSDSIKHHATPRNLALMSLVAVAGVALPLLLRRVRLQASWRAGDSRAAGRAARPAGEFAGRYYRARSQRNHGAGHHCSAAALRARAADSSRDEHWRTSPMDVSSASEDLSRLARRRGGPQCGPGLLESAGAQYLQPYGASQDPMPNLSELAVRAGLRKRLCGLPGKHQGALFVLCARYPAMDTETESYARIATPSLAAGLREAGYRTALFHSGRFMYLGMEAVVANRGYEVLEDAGAIGGHHESSFGVDEPSTVRRALAWIDSLARAASVSSSLICRSPGIILMTRPRPAHFPSERSRIAI